MIIPFSMPLKNMKLVSEENDPEKLSAAISKDG